MSLYEQVVLLRKLATRRLPGSEAAMAKAAEVVEISPASDGWWQMHGKTGTAYPRHANGRSDKAYGHGWYVGWATKGARTLTFARPEQDEHDDRTTTEIRVRAALLAGWLATIGTVPER